MGLDKLMTASRVGLAQSATSKQIGSLLFVSSALPFNMQPQTQSNWCWAATSTSVSIFYYTASTWTQCKVANGELGHTDCCNSPVPSPCNVPWYLDRALQRTGNFQSMVTGPITFASINGEISGGRPVGVRIGWSGGGGHFVVIYGCSRVGAVEYVDIDDPIYGKSHPTLATFTNSYQGSGRWTHTYYTKRWPTLNIKLPPLDASWIRQIEQARPLLALKRGDHETAVPPDVSLGIPHHVFTVGLNDLVERDDPIPQKPAALRVFEVDRGLSRAVFDLSPSNEGSPEVYAVADDPSTLEGLQRGLSEAARLADQGSHEPELRFLRVPALYVDAFWLHYLDAGQDMFIPVRDMGVLKSSQPQSAKTFFEDLRSAARERLKASRESTIAP